MDGSTVYFDTNLHIRKQIDLFAPLLEAWIGNDYLNCYLPHVDFFSYKPSDKFLIHIGRNSSYNKTDEDADRFRYNLIYIDLEGRYSEEENLSRIVAFLELAWANNIPTCAPFLADDLPFNGGEDGPVKWPD